MSNNKPRKDSPEEMLNAHQWLEAVAETLELDPQVTKTLMKELLNLTAQVAHGPSRPAAPVTTFLLGLAAGHATAADDLTTPTPDADIAATRARLEQLHKLLEKHGHAAP